MQSSKPRHWLLHYATARCGVVLAAYVIARMPNVIVRKVIQLPERSIDAGCGLPVSMRTQPNDASVRTSPALLMIPAHTCQRVD